MKTKILDGWALCPVCRRKLARVAGRAGDPETGSAQYSAGGIFLWCSRCKAEYEI